MKCYSNPKHSEYIKDERFVQNIMNDTKSQERKDFVNAVLGISLGAAVIVICWVAVVFLEGY